MRLDIELVNRNLYPTRAKAAAAIRSALVTVNGEVMSKPSRDVSETSDIQARPLPFVSGRGWLKLEHALKEFKINPHGFTCLDIGASTGGFTEVLLNQGAAKVIAVEVGQGQMVPELRRDERVLLFEKTDIRKLEPTEPVDLIVADVSFISLADILPAIDKWNCKTIITLIKPQFEVPRRIAAKNKGVIKSETDRWASVGKIINAFRKHGYKDMGLCRSPVNGGCGNIEFLALFNK